MRRRQGLTLIEVMVVLAIAVVVAALLLPALNQIRESALQARCRNNLKQIGEGLHGFHDQHSFFPTAGSTSRPSLTISGGSPPVGPAQAVGWAYQLSVYVGQESAYRANDLSVAAKLPVPLYFCPSRRGPTALNDRFLIDYAAGATTTGAAGLRDYPALVTRSTYVDHTANPPTVVSPGPVNVANVTDGIANTLALAEKRVAIGKYKPADLNTHWGDDWGWTDGWDADLVRLSTQQPARDGRNDGGWAFGSAHPYAFHAVFGDGSVRNLRYTLSTWMMTRLVDRRDGSAISLTE